MHFISQQCTAVLDGCTATFTTAEGTIVKRLIRPPGADAIMLELAQDERITLGLPECGAVTGGTALCLVRFGSGLPIPSAPTSRAELVDAEVWPLQFAGLSATPVAKGLA